ncbi:superinfection immunity protein [Vibrio diabolicus]|uniref:superinfection immunity protein n=1 Tax=Vibrio diabolicus TaxID=50719 RepID=UPI00211B33AC|nr:superinfection immunity protein [Vibrio diabolicus]MCG9618942.1 superinfection immunity protein [Vibrio diabolicus]
MSGVSIWQLLILIVLIPLAFLPSIIALKKNHPYKVPIVLINILGGLLWGVGWLIALIWCFVVPEKKAASITNIADEIDKLHSLKERGVISESEFNAKKKELMQL